MNETMTTSGIATYDVTQKSEPDSEHYKKKCFDMNKNEFSKLIKRNCIPDRIQKYMANFRNSDIYVNYNKVKINLKKLLGGNKK